MRAVLFIVRTISNGLSLLSILVAPAAPCKTTFPNEPLCHLSLWLGSEMHTVPVRGCISHPICSWQTVVHTSKMSLALTIAGRFERDNLSFAEVIKQVAACKTCEINVESLHLFLSFPPQLLLSKWKENIGSLVECVSVLYWHILYSVAYPAFNVALSFSRCSHSFNPNDDGTTDRSSQMDSKWICLFQNCFYSGMCHHNFLAAY